MRGFSMVEMMITVLVILIISATAIIRMQPAVQQSRANAAMSQIATILRSGREYAVAYRRYVQVTFPNYPGTKNQIQLTALNHLTNGAGNDAVLPFTNPAITFPTTVNYQLFAGLPDTPDAFGKGSAVYFNGLDGGPVAGMMFQPDGTFVDTTGTPVNGTIFLGVNNFTQSARAITILGATGRIKCYYGIAYSGTTYGWSQVQ
jgi:prepilin-type N-terminal cleavage/methylation domain-containing protein